MKVFDTDVLIEHLNGVVPATELVMEVTATGAPACSVLTRIEIEGGMRSRERPGVARLFAGMNLEPVSDVIAARAAEFMRRYRLSHSGIDVPDYVIAATVDVLGAELLTLNVKHYPMFEGLEPAF